MTPRAIAALSHADALRELSRLHGYDATAQTGALIIDVCLGDAEVKLEFEIEPGQDGGWDDPSWDESITLLGVLINGCWVGIDNNFSTEVTDAWQQAATDWLQKQRDTAKADRAESMARDRDEVCA